MVNKPLLHGRQYIEKKRNGNSFGFGSACFVYFEACYARRNAVQPLCTLPEATLCSPGGYEDSAFTAPAFL